MNLFLMMLMMTHLHYMMMLYMLVSKICPRKMIHSLNRILCLWMRFLLLSLTKHCLKLMIWIVYNSSQIYEYQLRKSQFGLKFQSWWSQAWSAKQNGCRKTKTKKAPDWVFSSRLIPGTGEKSRKAKVHTVLFHHV